MIRFAFAAILLMLASAASAQLVPKAEEIPIAPNTIAAAPCPLITSPIRFCGTSPAFVLTPQNDNAEITSYYATPEDIQAIAIVESLGLRDGLTIPNIQTAALEILSGASGQPTSSIPILERATVTIAGEARPNFVYSGVVDGFPIVYSNSMILLDSTLAQFVTLEVGVTTYSPRHRDLHTRFLANVQVLP